MPLNNPIILQAFRGQRPARVPVWFMRQAGRFLPEYRELRTKHPMLDLLRTPKLAAEVTMQPLNRFELDAGIIFADILTPLFGMGVALDFVEGEGPRIHNPVRSREDVANLRVPRAEDNVPYTLEAIELVVSQLTPRNIPLLGFSGAPFTLSSYLIQGVGGGNVNEVKRFMLNNPEAWRELQEKLSNLIVEYFAAQVKAGVSAVQLFDSWLGGLGPDEYLAFVAPYLENIVRETKTLGVPVVYFSIGTAGIMEHFAKFEPDVIGVDWRISLTQANNIFAASFPLQGNLDPALLLGPWPYVEQEARRILIDGSHLKAHIFNLGHGMLPETPLENVERLVKLVREFEVQG